MTLIATLVSRNVLVQVSDRRISWLHSNGSTELRDDKTNKGILYENRATLAFTGLAELEGESTDMWVAHRLAARSPNLNDGLELLTADLTRLFRNRPYRGQSHSIVIAGWKRNGPREPTGFSGLVSNVFQVGHGWRRTVSSEFDWFIQPEQEGKLLPTLVFAPAIVPRREQIALYRKLLRVKARGLNITNAVRLIVETFQDVSTYRPTVGRELMASVLPRSAVPPRDNMQVEALSRLVNPGAATFWTVTASGDFLQYGPTMVMNGVIVSGFQATSGPNFTAGIAVSRDASST